MYWNVLPVISVSWNTSTSFGEESTSVTITKRVYGTSGLKQLWPNIMSIDGALSYEAFPSVFTATPRFNRETYVESIAKYALEESDCRAVTFEINAENWFGRFSEPATFGVSQDNSDHGVRQNRITNELLLIKEYEEDSNCVTEAFDMKEGIDCVFYTEIEEERATLTTFDGYTYEGYDDFA